MTAIITERAPAGWDAYVLSRQDASLYHQSAWLELIRDAFGHRVFYLHCTGADGQLRGVLPLISQRSALFGHFLTSVPFFNYGGPVATDSQSRDALLEAAIQQAKDLGVRHVELRTEIPELNGWQLRSDKVAMIRPLPGSTEALGKELGSKLRSQVRRLDRENPQIMKGGVELLDDFYSVFANNMRELGTPVYSRQFFRLILQRFAGTTEIVCVRVGAKAVAACILFHSPQGTEIPWASCLASAKPLGANMRLYWEALGSAIARGSAQFDFGRSTVDAGTHRFKLQWGAKPRQQYWHYWMAPGRSMPQLHHGNPKLAAAIAVWQRMPLWLCNWIGPRIVRNLP
jgi:serine/alanine adding enzyme